jgi:polysaccharide export outer membrane protein
VLGQVQFPGEYALSAGGRVADVIRMAGGLRDGAFLEGAALVRGPEDTPRRVVFDLQRALDHASSPDNLLMFDGDRLSIPRQANTIRVEGEVRRPITIAWADGKGVGYYLDAAGGLTVDGDPNGVTIMLPNGRAAASRFLRGPDIRPGSTITVAAKPSPLSSAGAGGRAGRRCSAGRHPDPTRCQPDPGCGPLRQRRGWCRISVAPAQRWPLTSAPCA